MSLLPCHRHRHACRRWPTGKTGSANATTDSAWRLVKKKRKPIPATEIAVAWRTHIEYLPDPSRAGARGAGLVGQMYLFGGQKLEFAEADGTLTVDLIDVTPRPKGQKSAAPERWQFDKETLRKLIINDETFGKSYGLFLPWPEYRPDITKVRISARYDPENGPTLFAVPSDVSLSSKAPVWDGTLKNAPPGSTVEPGKPLKKNEPTRQMPQPTPPGVSRDESMRIFGGVYGVVWPGQ